MTSSRSCGSMIPETAARKAAAAVEPFAVDTGGGAGQLDIVVDVELADDISEHQRANRAPNLCPRTRAPFLMCPFLYLNLANSTTRVSDLNCREKQFLTLRDPFMLLDRGTPVAASTTRTATHLYTLYPHLQSTRTPFGSSSTNREWCIRGSFSRVTLNGARKRSCRGEW